jgi:hypothetical protein
MSHDFLDLVNDALTTLDHSIHNKIEGSFIDNFIHELQGHLDKLQSASLITSLPSTTILAFAKYDGNFAECFDYDERKIYYIPKDNIVGSKPEPGEALKWYSPGKFYVDYTGIPAEENKIDDYLSECTIAK